MNSNSTVQKPTSVIFLDIDGVLIGDRGSPVLSESIRKKVNELFIKKEGLNAGFTELEWRVAASYFLTPSAVFNLDKLIAKVSKVANVAIVISSMWRNDGSVADLREKMFDRYAFSSLIIDKTQKENDYRGVQIAYWLRENKDRFNVKSFVIFDDYDEKLSKLFHSRFVLVKELLSEEDVAKGYTMMTQFSDTLEESPMETDKVEDAIAPLPSTSLQTLQTNSIAETTTSYAQEALREFPSVLNHYHKSYHYKDHHEVFEILKGVSERISTIYADFLTPTANRNQKQLGFMGTPNKYPEAECVKKFKNILAENIFNKLYHSIEARKRESVYLSTDYAPQELLGELLTSCGISFNQYDLFKIFPIKTGTTIGVYPKDNRIDVSMTPSY